MKKIEQMLVGERTFSVLLVILSLAVLYLAYQIAGFSSANSSGAFPLAVGLIMLLSSLSILLELRKKSRPDSHGWLDSFKQFAQQHFPKRTLIFGGLAVAYLASIQWLSFYLSTFLFLLLSMIYLRNGRIVGAVLTSGLLLLLIYLMFTLAFSVYLP